MSNSRSPLEGLRVIRVLGIPLGQHLPNAVFTILVFIIALKRIYYVRHNRCYSLSYFTILTKTYLKNIFSKCGGSINTSMYTYLQMNNTYKICFRSQVNK